MLQYLLELQYKFIVDSDRLRYIITPWATTLRKHIHTYIHIYTHAYISIYTEILIKN